MSLILKALEKAKAMAGRKSSAAPPPPAALASFRFGRPSKAQRIRKIGILCILISVVAVSLAYTVRYWSQRLRKPGVVVVNRTVDLPPLPDPVPPADDAQATPPDAAPAPAEQPAPASQPEPAPKQAQPQPAKVLAP